MNQWCSSLTETWGTGQNSESSWQRFLDTWQPRRKWLNPTLFYRLRLQIWNCKVYDPPFLLHFIFFHRGCVKCFMISVLVFRSKVPGCGIFNNSPLALWITSEIMKGDLPWKTLNSITYIIRWDAHRNGPELQLGSSHWLDFRKAGF